MDGDKDAGNGTLCQSRSHLEPFDLPLHLGHTTFLRSASDNLSAHLFLNLVLHDILIHDTIIELVRIFQSVVVIYFTILGLNQVSLRWIDYVSDGVVLLIQFTCLHLLIENRFVVPRGLLLLHEPTRW